MDCQCTFLILGNQHVEATKSVFVYIFTPILIPATNISLSKRPFEKYKPMGLFSGFLGMSFLRGLYQIGQNSWNSQKLVHENVYPTTLKMSPLLVGHIVSMLPLHDVISTINLRFRISGQWMNTYRLETKLYFSRR